MATSERKRSKRMLPAIKQLIAFRATWDSNKDRQVLAEELITEIKAKFPKEIPPVDETIIKMISAARNREIQPLDKTWHLGTIKEYPVTSEAIPYILKVQALPKIGNRGMTIRQALWTARLWSVIKDIELLGEVSWHYALNEKTAQVAGTAFDTSEMDKILLKNKEVVLKYFEDSFGGANFEMQQAAFKSLTGYELKEPLPAENYQSEVKK